MLKKCLMLAALLVAPTSFAVNKCMLPDGTVEYSDKPCASNAKASQPRLVDNTIIDGKTYQDLAARQAAEEQKVIAAQNAPKKCTLKNGLGQVSPPMDCVEAYKLMQQNNQNLRATLAAQQAAQAAASANSPKFTNCNKFGNTVNCTTY
ncbi:DUF4124 domain-containing protein [Chitiniphilus eburneus]|uniref:DUF4124 domain-containing protein n=1 Tax=Chitiniphilus eburneus TaxID=2571148 RepID=A0A4U0PNQ7_9NEIS|nr:DUF4124 domain-containing protein [Chitiniphilus eburneus]TJZ69749.1 DUF4124 domain-containing protein [Chitiniphilus eburneus]